MKQLEIHFDAGIRERFSSFADCLKGSAYSCGRQLKAVASDLDMSSSELSRKLAGNPADPVHFPAHLLPDLIRATNLDPVYWLVEEFLEAAEDKKKRAHAELSALLPKLVALMEKAA